MGVSGGPDMIQDGLVLALDAADRNSYVSGSTTWTDLSGNNNSGSLVNGPTFSSANSGNLIFVGSSSQYTNCNVSLNVAQYSVNWWLNPSNVTNFNQQIALLYNYTGVYDWGGFLFHTTSTGGVYVGTSVASRISPWRNNVVISNTWQNFTWTFNSGAATFYKNGIVETSATLTTSTLPSFTNFVTNPSGSLSGINGSLSAINVYNRALTATEITQNYNAQKSRFGLT